MFKLKTFAPPAQPPNRHAANWLLLATAAVIAYHTQHIPFWLALVTAGLIVWRYLVENYRWRPPGRVLLFMLLVVSTLLVYRQYGTLLGRDPGVGFLVLLTGLKLTELRTLRDYQFSVLLLYFLAMSAFLFSQSLLVGGYAFIVAALTTMALIKLNHTHVVSANEASRHAFGLLSRALPIMLVVYFMFPRVQGGLWGVPDDAFGHTGLSDRIELGQILRLLRDDKVAFRVTFSTTPPAKRELYWRAFVLTNTFDGRVWGRPDDIRSVLLPEAYQALDEPLEYEVTLQPHNKRWLLSLGLPRDAPPGTRLRGAHELESRRPLRQSFTYRLQSHLRYHTAPLQAEQLVPLLTLPALDPRLVALTDRWRKLGEPEKIIQSALHLFREQGFRYTLSPPELGADPITDFLFRTKSGYCEHYAAAFVTLMRSAGVPSRIVVGYLGGEINPIGDYMIVRNSDAHAWAEVWLPGRGWTRIDPTAAVAPERVELGLNALLGLANLGREIGTLSREEIERVIQPGWLRKQWRTLRLRWDALNNIWDKWVKDYDLVAQQELLSWLGVQAPNWIKMVVLAVGAVIVLVLVFAAFLFYPRRHKDPVVQLYCRFCSKLAKRGLRRDPHEGPMNYARRVIRERPELQPSVQAITDIYIRLRYDRTEPAGVHALRERVRAF